MKKSGVVVAEGLYN